MCTCIQQIVDKINEQFTGNCKVLNDYNSLQVSKRFIKDITYQLYWQHLFIFHVVKKRREYHEVILDLYKLFGPGQKKIITVFFDLHQNSFGPVEGPGINYYKCCRDKYVRHVNKTA